MRNKIIFLFLIIFYMVSNVCDAKGFRSGRRAKRASVVKKAIIIGAIANTLNTKKEDKENQQNQQNEKKK